MRSALAILILSATAATAECPTRAAMEHGAEAYVSYPDGSVVVQKWIGEGVIQETTRYEDGVGEYRMFSMGGVFISYEVDLDGDRELRETRISTEYPLDLPDRLPVTPNESFGVAAINRYDDGTDPAVEHISLRSGGMADVDIAGCPYQGFPILMTYSWGDSLFTSFLTHIPELGISVELARMDDGEAPEPFAPQRFSLDPP